MKICRRLVDAPLLDPFKEFVIVAIIDVNSNEHRAGCVEGLLEHWGDLVWSLNHEAVCPECFRIFHRIDWAELSAGRPAIFLFLLNGNHVIRSINPDHVDEIRLESYGRFEFHCRKEKTAVA